ncbi:hypothetical protein [Achromobacter xylosoxidans]|uniref:hypothetical protein n=1 Tax=Alcaligenes xylosoxydans xylosoxydans TaxID=85698 RepID=UPI002A747383|nr:hypothetical protein [Achromobacter xylosoxidans]WPQ33684.1 hypothetical protein SLH34_24105 [Achromobacter xylosoxidans]WPQ37775.1 hypothetical protein SLH34_13260 [Achromobacter xylosoxidans]
MPNADTTLIDRAEEAAAPNEVTLTFHCDAEEAQALAAEVQRLIQDSPPWLQWLVAQALESGQAAFDLFQVDGNRDPASAAGDVWFLAKPTERLRLLVAALRARNGDREAGVFFEREFEHGALLGKRLGVVATIVPQEVRHVPPATDQRLSTQKVWIGSGDA